MVVGSSGITPVPRGSGARSVPEVTPPERQSFESPRRKGAGPEIVLDQTAKPGEPPFIDADFEDILREAAAMANAHVPEDETLRLAHRAYTNAAGAVSLRGVLLDVDS